MLSSEELQVIKSTVGVLESQGEALTCHFYRRLFQENPEVSDLFNPANQREGAQQRALAGAICAYAKNIESPESLLSAIEVIAQKHVSLQIRPEHYPIVGKNLLASISELLGLADDDPILKAWAKAYGDLAEIFVNREAQIYNEITQAENGWTGFKNLLVSKVVDESSEVRSFYLVSADGKLPLFTPGQYITVRVPFPDGRTTMRHYSLSCKPGDPFFRISVKREVARSQGDPEGYVSNYVSNELKKGSLIEVAMPCGEFVLSENSCSSRPLVFLAGGVGITPLVSMLQVALQDYPQRDIRFVQATRNRKTLLFRNELETLEGQFENLRCYVRFSDAGLQPSQPRESMGFVDSEFLTEILNSRDGEYYFCGPPPFMKGIQQILKSWHIPDHQVNFEFFGPKQSFENVKIG